MFLKAFKQRNIKLILISKIKISDCKDNFFVKKYNIRCILLNTGS